MILKYSLGDLIFIPLQSGGGVVAKILYISNKNSKVILIGICNGRLKAKPGLNTYNCNNNGQYVIQPFYTSANLILDGEWEIIGNVGLSKDDTAYSLRIYAGRVYLGHEMLRRANKDDYNLIPRDAVKGFKMVYQLIEGYLGSE